MNPISTIRLARISHRLAALVLATTLLTPGSSMNASPQAASASPTPSQTAAPSHVATPSHSATPLRATPSQAATLKRSQYHASHFPKRATMFYTGVWGIDSLLVRATESGELVRFSYRVLDPARAKQLNDKKAEPALIDYRARVKLVVPALEKVGQLRQSSTPEAGKEYWMAFSNPRKTVKRGDRVSVVIGTFHADNLVVE